MKKDLLTFQHECDSCGAVFQINDKVVISGHTPLMCSACHQNLSQDCMDLFLKFLRLSDELRDISNQLRSEYGIRFLGPPEFPTNKNVM